MSRFGSALSLLREMKNSVCALRTRRTITDHWKAFRNTAFSGVDRKFPTEVLPLFVLKMVTKVGEVSGLAG